VKKIFLLLTCKGSLPPLIGQGDRPLGGWLEKNHPRFAPVFFSAKPCAIKAEGNLKACGKATQL
jgi:hypothetical protein